ncbi:MFS transporter prlL [Pseudocercospora fuligena]|uniref:MFS transporter prlL n=1 Tax=Pseudocercospora fuligena TaxID=685502 RepID=A0A8H6VEA8_9PEZI|nr:MFS transporter prlL [Pseudocercospora fuligena]
MSDLDVATKYNSPEVRSVSTEPPNNVAEAGSREAFLASFTQKDDRAIMKKVDRRFLLLIGILYMTKNIDYTNAANVKVLQVGQPRNVLNELHMTSDQYNWVQSIYFIAYIVFEVPSNLLLKKMTPRIWQSRIICSWGIVLACHAAIQNRHSYYALRFLLGMMEAGLFPGLAVQLCSWYRSDEMGKPIMWMFGMQNCSGVVGSLLAYGISYMNGMCGMSAWRWVYLLEGIYTILLAGVVWLVLPDYPKSPTSNKWLTPREQEYLEVRLSENAPLTEEAAFNKAEVIAALKDPRTYAFMLNQLLINLGGYGLSWYLPTITTNLGFAGLPRNQLLNIPPAAASVLAIIAAGLMLDRAWVTRPVFTQPIMAGCVVCFVLFFTISSKVGIYIACVLGTMFYSVYFIPFWAWRSSTLKGMTGSAFALAFQSCVGQVGGVVGPQLFQSKWAYNRYKTSFAICAASIILAWVANIWIWWLTRNVEWDVRRIRRLRIKAEKRGEVYDGDDVKVYEERHFYNGLHKTRN